MSHRLTEKRKTLSKATSSTNKVSATSSGIYNTISTIYPMPHTTITVLYKL
jgi:hypothetical protein